MTREEENREKEIAHAAESEYFVTKAEEFAWIRGAEWADQHPRKGLWDSEKVIDWIKKTFSETDKRFNENYSDMLIECLCKAMED